MLYITVFYQDVYLYNFIELCKLEQSLLWLTISKH